MTSILSKARNWEFKGIVPANETDVSENARLRAIWDQSVGDKDYAPALSRPTEVTLGQPLALIDLPNSIRRMPASDVQDYLVTAEQYPSEKGHQIEALKAAASGFKGLGL